MPSRLQRVAKATAFAICLNHFDAWTGLAIVFRSRLHPKELAALAWAALRALDAADVKKLIAAVSGGAGIPLPPLFDPVEDAAWWASVASNEELTAYCLASFRRMPAAEQRAIIEHVQAKHPA